MSTNPTTPGKIFLIPTPIADHPDVYQCMPRYNQEVIQQLDYFIVEDLRSARRFLSKAKIGRPIDTLTFVELNEHTQPSDFGAMLTPVLEGRSAGILSEAGVPCVADPGADVVALAHAHGIPVVPLVGPSSIILALSASGMNGQNFAFNGYLPVKPDEKRTRIKELERLVQNRNQTQLFIETPYRNEKLFEDILLICADQTKFCVACNINAPDEYIRSASIAQWKRDRNSKPDLKKRPALFLLGQ